MSLAGLIAYIFATNQIQPIINNPLAQLGPPNKPMIGALLLPEVNRTKNEYKEQRIRLRSLPANHSTRYSPVQLRNGAMGAEMLVTLGNSDIGSELTSQDYDALVAYLDATDEAGIPPMEAIAILIRFADVTLVSPLAIRNEIDRWTAIVQGIIKVRGDNNYTEDVIVPTDPGHRVIVAGDWNNPAYDIYGEIQAGVAFMAAKGKKIVGLYAGNPVVMKMRRNNSFRDLSGSLTVQGNNLVGQRRAYIDKETLDNQLTKDTLPPITQYDTTYEIDGGAEAAFLDRGALVMVASTGEPGQIEVPGSEPLILEDTLGYVGQGVGAGQNVPGKVVKMFPYEDKPPRIEGQGWQSSGVVITNPNDIFVFGGI